MRRNDRRDPVRSAGIQLIHITSMHRILLSRMREERKGLRHEGAAKGRNLLVVDWLPARTLSSNVCHQSRLGPEQMETNYCHK